MITFLVIKFLDRHPPDDPGAIWYGAGFAFLLDAFLVSVGWGLIVLL